MKKLILVAIGVFLSGALYAATTNVPLIGGISVLTAAQVLNSTPTYAGQVIVCADCTTVAYGGAGYTLCVATEATTARNGFILAGSSTAVVSACK